MLNFEFECWIWILNIEFEYLIWVLNLNVEFKYLILNLNIGFKYKIWMLNFNIGYWIWKLNVTGAESDLKDSGYIFRFQTWGVFFADVLTLIGWGRVVFVVDDYCTQRMVIQYLIPGKIGLTSDIFECVIMPYLVGFVDFLKF